MGMKSQIFVIGKDVTRGVSSLFVYNPEYRLLAAKHFQWNYGEEMISRARHTMEWLTRNTEGINLHLLSTVNKSKLDRIVDVNFDTKDVASSYDIEKEAEQYGANPCTKESFREWFCLDNDEGQLYIIVSTEEIRYALYYVDDDKVMSAEQYLSHYKEYEYEDKTLDNINYINNHATLMSYEELMHVIDEASSDAALRISKKQEIQTQNIK